MVTGIFSQLGAIKQDWNPGHVVERPCAVNKCQAFPQSLVADSWSLRARKNGPVLRTSTQMPSTLALPCLTCLSPHLRPQAITSPWRFLHLYAQLPLR